MKNSSRGGFSAALVLICLILCSCTLRKAPSHLPDTGGAAGSAVYRGKYVSEEGESGRFKAWIWAASPDRLHVEVYGPMGGTRLVMDGGGGKLVVVDPKEKVAYVGDSAGRNLSPLLGVGLTLHQLVAGITGSEIPEGVDHWFRDPSSGPGLPMRMEAGAGESRLELRMLRFHPLPPGSEDQLGKGAAPTGWRLRPLEDIFPAAGR